MNERDPLLLRDILRAVSAIERYTKAGHARGGCSAVVEYKDEHLLAGELEQRPVGEVCAESSGGKCLFLMAVKKDEAGRDVRAQLDTVIGRS